MGKSRAMLDSMVYTQAKALRDKVPPTCRSCPHLIHNYEVVNWAEKGDQYMVLKVRCMLKLQRGRESACPDSTMPQKPTRVAKDMGMSRHHIYEKSLEHRALLATDDPEKYVGLRPRMESLMSEAMKASHSTIEEWWRTLGEAFGPNAPRVGWEGPEAMTFSEAEEHFLYQHVKEVKEAGDERTWTSYLEKNIGNHMRPIRYSDPSFIVIEEQEKEAPRARYHNWGMYG